MLVLNEEIVLEELKMEVALYTFYPLKSHHKAQIRNRYGIVRMIAVVLLLLIFFKRVRRVAR